MTVKTCLLVTDDPDDHQTFSEAFADVSSNAVVLNVVDSHKALELITSHKHIPDFFIVDVSMHGMRINTFLKAIRADDMISRTLTVLYGFESDMKNVDRLPGTLFFNKEYRYTDLRNFLKGLIAAQFE
jgi:CheY-like chemotaxis protein